MSTKNSVLWTTVVTSISKVSTIFLEKSIILRGTLCKKNQSYSYGSYQQGP